jgi:hypothetical protein
MSLKQNVPRDCPFCHEDLLWRSSDKQWIHPNNGCVLVGIGLHNDALVDKWNGEEPTIPAPASLPQPRLPTVASSEVEVPNLPVPPPVSAPAVRHPWALPAKEEPGWFETLVANEIKKAGL